MKNKEGVAPLLLQKRSKSSRFSNWTGDANYFRDKLFRGLYVFLLFAIDFVMFIYSINGRLFEDGVFNRAVAIILEVALAVSLVLIFCLSFSRLLQNIVCALFTVLITVIFFNQFALFDTSNFLEQWLNQKASWLTFLCLIPSSWMIGLIFGGIVFFAFRFSDAILFVTLVLFLSGVIGVQKNEMIRPTQYEYTEVKSLDGAGHAGKSSSNIIYLMVSHFPSYQFLNSMDNPMFRDLRDLLIGFYAVNQFEVYPNAFVQNTDAMNNVIDIFNQVDYSSTSSGNRGYAEYLNKWNFVHGSLEQLSLEDNVLYDYLKKNGYGVSMYAMPQFDFCLKGGEFSTNRCVVKGYKTVKLYDKNFSVEKNVYALLGEWVLSIKSRGLNGFAKMLLNMSSLKGYKVISENRRVSIEGADALFDRLSADYVQDRGDQAYLAYVDLPSDIYIYDEFCNIKPRKNWVAINNNSLYSGNIEEKKTAYIDQAKCLVGKMQEFMDEIVKQKKINNTSIFIQGVSPARELASRSTDKYVQFVTDKLVNLAVRKSEKPKFMINANICLASDFTKTYIRYQDFCYTIDDMKMNQDDLLSLRNNLIHNSVIRSNKISNIVANYRDWYEQYKLKNMAYRKKVEQQKGEDEARKKREEIAAQQKKLVVEKEQSKKVQTSDDNIFELTDDLAADDKGADNVVPKEDKQENKPVLESKEKAAPVVSDQVDDLLQLEAEENGTSVKAEIPTSESSSKTLEVLPLAPADDIQKAEKQEEQLVIEDKSQPTDNDDILDIDDLIMPDIDEAKVVEPQSVSEEKKTQSDEVKAVEEKTSVKSEDVKVIEDKSPEKSEEVKVVEEKKPVKSEKSKKESSVDEEDDDEMDLF